MINNSENNIIKQKGEMKGCINSVEKALKVLECFDSSSSELNLTQISERMNLPKSSTLNLIKTLMQAGYLYKAKGTQSYQLGYKILQLYYSMHASLPIVQLAVPLMDKLHMSTNCYIYLSTTIDGKVMILEGVYPHERLLKYSSTGKIMPMHCTASGKAMLSCMPRAMVDEILDRYGLTVSTPNTITDREILYRELDWIKEHGYSIDREEESMGSVCIAAAICNKVGAPVGAISISGTAQMFSTENINKYHQMLLPVVQILSNQAELFPPSQLGIV